MVCPARGSGNQKGLLPSRLGRGFVRAVEGVRLGLSRTRRSPSLGVSSGFRRLRVPAVLGMTMSHAEGLIGSLRRRGRTARGFYRYGGATAVVTHTLAVLGYRRQIIFEMSLDPPPPLLEPGISVKYGFLQPDDLDEFAAYHPYLGLEEARRRVSGGERCFVGRVGGQIVTNVWIVRGVEAIRLDRLDYPLAPDEAYVHGAYTIRDVRGLRVAPAALASLGHLVADEGVKRMWGAVLPENVPGVRQALRAGMQEKVRAATLVLGARRAYRVPYLPRGKRSRD
jgi:hypothetical protein